MSAPKMTRHEMKQDDLVTAVEKAGEYLATNRALVRNWGIAAAIVLVLGLTFLYLVQSRASSAAQLLHQGQIKFAAGVAPEKVRPDDPASTYPSEADRDRAALDIFSQVVARYGSRSEGRLALYYQGLLFARLGRHAEAQAALEEFLKKSASDALVGVAKTQLAQIRAQGGDLEGAAKIYSDLAEQKGSAYPRDWALFYLAQTLDQQGKGAEAAATYRKILSEFPDSPAASLVSRKLEAAPPAS